MAISGVANLEDLSDHGDNNGDVYCEGDSGIGDEDSWYAQLQSWVEGIQTSEELENNNESGNSKHRQGKWSRILEPLLKLSTPATLATPALDKSMEMI